jgi:hypothetical protein
MIRSSTVLKLSATSGAAVDDAALEPAEMGVEHKHFLFRPEHLF